MKIKKYIKTSKNKYKICLENDENIIIYEDLILSHNLLLKKEIDNLELLKQENEKYALYDKALIYINKRLRCEKEIYNYLKKYTNDFKEIENIILKLKNNGYLNEELYLKSYIHDKINFTNDGPEKIKRELLNFNFDTFLIDDYLIIFDEDLCQERIEKYINKYLKVNKKSLLVFKQKMLLNLLNLGYLKEDINKVLNKINFEDTNLKEKEIIKLRKKYEKKYQGEELNNLIKKKLYEKGFFE